MQTAIKKDNLHRLAQELNYGICYGDLHFVHKHSYAFALVLVCSRL